VKLRGTWVTVNNITRFVRDPDPVKPKRKPRGRKPKKPKKPAEPKLLRAKDVRSIPNRPKKVRTKGKRPVDGRFERETAPDVHLLRCLNPDCNAWFCSYRSNASACGSGCIKVMEDLHPRLCSYGINAEGLRRHAALVSKRNARIYDTPKLTPYARRLILTTDQGNPTLDGILMAASVQSERRAAGFAASIAYGLRSHGHGRAEDADTFNDFYLLGLEWSAANPRRPCDRAF
jgi:hypothetical protein